MKKLTVIPMVLLVVLLITSVVFAQEYTGVPLVSTLSGAEEAPGPGDPDGSGFVTVRLNHGQRQVCWTISYENIVAPTAAHIHIAPAGSPGPVVVPLSPISGGCREVSQDLIKAIIQNPENYYVNVHNPVHPAGAIRGQLSNKGLSE